MNLKRAADWAAVAALAVCITVALVSCSQPAASSPVAAASAAATATAGQAISSLSIADALQGTWKATVENTTASSGSWQLRVTANDMLLQNPVGGDEFSIQPIALTDSSLTLAADAGCPDQTSVTDGRYTYVITGEVLTFTAIGDSCGDRKGVLTSSKLAALEQLA